MFMVSHPSINKLIINNISNSFKIFVTCANDGKKKVVSVFHGLIVYLRDIIYLRI